MYDECDKEYVQILVQKPLKKWARNGQKEM
jgi:hypothetical protein